MSHQLELEIQPQPDDAACGPTCLHAVYRFFGDRIPLQQVIAEVTQLEEGGTLAVLLGLHALGRGYRARIYTYNLHVFDPTWFDARPSAQRTGTLVDKLRGQLKFKSERKLRVASHGYIEFLGRGGEILYRDLNPGLIREYLRRGIPILTGLSATYLYGCSREHADEYDDLRGQPTGHFVVLSGYDRESGRITVADPLQDNPAFGDRYYDVEMHRLLASILLGVVTYDANLLIIQPAGDWTAGRKAEDR